MTETHLNEELPGDSGVDVGQGVGESAGELAALETPRWRHYLAPLVALAAWIVPGSGHLLVGRWGRALTFSLVVSGLAIIGFLAKGQVFPPHSDDPFGTLGFLADACSGVFFVLAHLFEKTGPDVSRAAGDYGTRFVAAAGIVNLLGVLDAYRIAVGAKA